MKSNTFNWGRVWALFVRYWAEKKIANLLLWLVTGALMTWFFDNVHFTAIKNGYGPGRIEEPVFLIGFPAFMLVQMAIAFTEMTNRKTVANFLMIPSTRREKFLFLLVNHLILPTLFYCISAFLLDWVVFKFFYLGSEMLLIKEHFGVFDIRYNLFHFVTAMFSVLFVFGGYFALRKNQLLYSLLMLVLVFYIALSMLDDYLVRNMISKDLFSSRVLDGVDYSHNKFLAQLDNGILYDFQPYSFIAIGLYFGGMAYVAFLKFREKQVKV